MTDHPWHAILPYAIVGADRRTLSVVEGTPPSTTDALGQLLAQVDVTQPDKALLDALALADAHWQGGQRPITLTAAEPPLSPPDDTPRCSPLSTQHLQQMLNGDYGELLPEWLEALTAAKRRIPEEYLPEVLEFGRTKAELRPALLPILGHRGRWLARLNPAWNYAVPFDESTAESVWETGTRLLRLNILTWLRQKNPAQARELVIKVWAKERAEDRSAFIAALAANASIEDEPFLESALDDRAKEVRRAAAQILAGLPESRLGQRMAERAQHYVTLKPDQKLEVKLPTACNEAMLRDGIEPKTRSKRGEKAWWLQQIISATPLKFWTQTVGLNPAILLTLATGTDWRAMLVEGWAQAAMNQHEADWAEAILRDVLKNDLAISLGALLLRLPPERRTTLALHALKLNASLDDNQPPQRLLDEYQAGWDEALSRAVMEQLTAQLRNLSTGHYHHHLVARLRHLALRLHPSVAPDATQLSSLVTDEAKYKWLLNALEQFILRLQFRQAMLKELSE